jgi:hypothetical protein
MVQWPEIHHLVLGHRIEGIVALVEAVGSSAGCRQQRLKVDLVFGDRLERIVVDMIVLTVMEAFHTKVGGRLWHRANLKSEG